MAIIDLRGRAAWAIAFPAIVTALMIGGIYASPHGDFRTVGQPCTQVSTNGSVAIQCGTQGGGGAGGDFGGCTNAYGNYQNCVVQMRPRS
jgi:hypothetical protein